MKVNVAYNGNVFVKDVEVADNFWLKLCGYMFRGTPHVQGLMFTSGLIKWSSIHTNFMKFNLDLVFLNKENKVVKVVRDIKPWRATNFYFGVHRTLELPVGHLPQELKEGDILEVIHV